MATVTVQIPEDHAREILKIVPHWMGKIKKEIEEQLPPEPISKWRTSEIVMQLVHMEETGEEEENLKAILKYELVKRQVGYALDKYERAKKEFLEGINCSHPLLKKTMGPYMRRGLVTELKESREKLNSILNSL